MSQLRRKRFPGLKRKTTSRQNSVMKIERRQDDRKSRGKPKLKQQTKRLDNILTENPFAWISDESSFLLHRIHGRAYMRRILGEELMHSGHYES